MKYQNRICCFIDILGFKDHINESIDENNLDRISKIESIIKVVDLSKKIAHHGENELAKSKVVTQFSDSLVISFDIEEPSQVFYSLHDMLIIAMNFTIKGYLLRGGVSFGKLIHTDKYVFGPALVAAYELESNCAIYPRILIDESVLAIGATYRTVNKVEDEREFIEGLLAVDTDGRRYLDYIAAGYEEFDEPNFDQLEYLNYLKQIINKGLSSTNETVIKKMNWLRDKTNNYITAIKNKSVPMYEIDGDPELATAYHNLELIP